MPFHMFWWQPSQSLVWDQCAMFSEAATGTTVLDVEWKHPWVSEPECFASSLAFHPSFISGLFGTNLTDLLNEWKLKFLEIYWYIWTLGTKSRVHEHNIGILICENDWNGMIPQPTVWSKRIVPWDQMYGSSKRHPGLPTSSMACTTPLVAVMSHWVTVESRSAITLPR